MSSIEFDFYASGRRNVSHTWRFTSAVRSVEFFSNTKNKQFFPFKQKDTSMIKILVGDGRWPSLTHNFSYTVAPRISCMAIAVLIGLLLVGFVGSASGETVGLVAAYSFDEAAGTLAGDSSSTHSHTGTIKGAAWVPAGRFDSALSFNGTNALVTVSDAADLDLSTGMTLEAWVNPTALSGWRTAILKEKPNGLAYALYAHDNAPRPAGYINVGGSDIEASGNAGLPLNTWSHLAATYDGAILRLYVNGVEMGSQAVSGAIVASTLPLQIGGNAVWGEYFTGLIDEVRVYNRALSMSEIQIDMTAPIGLAPPPPPPPSPSEIGQWSPPVELGLVAVNMVHLHTGKILMYGGENNGGTSATVWDPATGNFYAVPAPYNIFCSGHAALADGRILVVGGHDNANNILGSDQAALFDPITESWTSVPHMSYRRWYPTATALTDGRILVTSGATTCFDCIADIPEIYDPASNSWTQLGSAQLAFPYYPFIFLLPDGRILNAGAGEQPAVTSTLDLLNQQWTTLDPTVVDGGSAAMFLPGKIIKSGTAATTDISNLPTAATTYILDTTQAAPKWRQTPSMAFPRAYHTLTMLPDGKVLATSGGVTTEGKDVSTAVFEAELWTPASETWKTMAAMQAPRLYHSTALLLPDGRVVVAGSGDSYGGPNQTTAEFYSPPYLFKGARPGIASAPSVISHGSTFSLNLTDASAIGSVALVKPGAVTHQFDEDQRYLNLAFSQSGSSITVDAPATAALAPPGYYMLFVLSDTGIPSIASWIHLTSASEDTEPPSPPTGLNAAAIGSTQIKLTWTASTDNVAVTGYRLERCQEAGCSNFAQIATPAATSYTDSGLTAGTVYQYRVRAIDAAGNLSVYSPVAAATTLTITTSGFLSPAANVPVTSSAGDKNGFQTNPSNAYANDSLFAVDTNSGTGTGTSCTASGKDKHIYYEYGFTLNGASIAGIEVRLDARVDATAGAPKMCVQLSWDGGTTWTAAKTTTTLTTTETTYTLGGAADTWGRAWTAINLSNANFRVRIINVASNTSRDFSLDWTAVQVTYQ
jgi:hypothetical protein